MARAAVCLAVALLGCVSTAEHQRALDERDELAGRLAAQDQSFGAEREQLASELEDLRAERDGLTRDVEALRVSRDQLSARESELSQKAQQLDAIHPTYEGLVRDLEADLAAAQSQIDALREGLRMSLPAETLFAPGSAELTPEGEAALARVAAQLRDAPYDVQVLGHSDGAAIRGGLAQRFPSNWELAGARAARVVRALEADGVPPARLAAISMGEHHPVSENDTPEGRAANRRIEIRLLPLPGAAPGPAPPGFQAPAR